MIQHLHATPFTVDSSTCNFTSPTVPPFEIIHCINSSDSWSSWCCIPSSSLSPGILQAHALTHCQALRCICTRNTSCSRTSWCWMFIFRFALRTPQRNKRKLSDTRKHTHKQTQPLHAPVDAAGLESLLVAPCMPTRAHYQALRKGCMQNSFHSYSRRCFPPGLLLRLAPCRHMNAQFRRHMQSHWCQDRLR